jgi:hypothetical protein
VYDGVTQSLHRYAAFQARRVLTQMDRDPGSPTHGCFDRNHWHYKIRDFPSSILQQGAFTLEALRRGDVRLGIEPTRAGPWALAAVNALSRQVDGRGRVDEYFPFEDSYPAGAFGLYVAARLAWGWGRTEPALARGIDWPGLRRLARHMAGRIELQASNQYAAGIAGLALAARVPQFEIGPEEARRHAARLFASQHAEGWFEEYGGPDFGYLAVTLDALADYGDATGDPRAAVAVQRAVEFLAGQVGADGALPSSLNSRNTDYVVPYGLVRAAARLPTASWLVHRLFAGADDPGHFLWATDDRYHCHYVHASVVRSLPNLGAMVAPAEPARPRPPVAARLRVPGRPRRGRGLLGPCGGPQGRACPGPPAGRRTRGRPWLAHPSREGAVDHQLVVGPLEDRLCRRPAHRGRPGPGGRLHQGDGAASHGIADALPRPARPGDPAAEAHHDLPQR